MSDKKVNKFTLIELLLVVAIIGILVTLLMPSLGRAREAAKRAVCLSNVSQQAKKVHIFSKEFDGKAPLTHVTQYKRNSSHLKQHVWSAAGTMYKAKILDSEALLICPSGVSNINQQHVGQGYTFEEIESEWRALTDYGYRPVQRKNSGEGIEDKLSFLNLFADKAIISEWLYGRYINHADYSSQPFHGKVNVTAFGDGHAKVIWDKNGSKFINIAKTRRNNDDYYKTGSDGEVVSGVWYELDREF